MPYSTDYQGSARRKLAAAKSLFEEARPGKQPGHRATAAYLYGLAAEMALKAMLVKVNPTSSCLVEHFPHLRNQLRDAIEGRGSTPLLAYADSDSLFNHWSIDIRYAPTTDIDSRYIDQWRKQAQKLVEDMESQ